MAGEAIQMMSELHPRELMEGLQNLREINVGIFNNFKTELALYIAVKPVIYGHCFERPTGLKGHFYEVDLLISYTIP